MIRRLIGVVSVLLIAYSGWNLYSVWSDNAETVEQYKLWMAGRITIASSDRRLLIERKVEADRLRLRAELGGVAGALLLAAVATYPRWRRLT